MCGGGRADHYETSLVHTRARAHTHTHTHCGSADHWQCRPRRTRAGPTTARRGLIEEAQRDVLLHSKPTRTHRDTQRYTHRHRQTDTKTQTQTQTHTHTLIHSLSQPVSGDKAVDLHTTTAPTRPHTATGPDPAQWAQTGYVFFYYIYIYIRETIVGHDDRALASERPRR
jgi:hypothetical protein